MPKSHPPYPEAFRADAVALVQRTGKPIAEVAADLGVSGESLRKWVQQAKADAGEGPPGALTTDEREELRRLRRENKTLQMEREILRKAAAFFAKETL
jgi:transposase